MNDSKFTACSKSTEPVQEGEEDEPPKDGTVYNDIELTDDWADYEAVEGEDGQNVSICDFKSRVQDVNPNQ